MSSNTGNITVVEPFTGCGGMALGLERAGMHAVAFSEVDELCTRILAKHWPDVPNLGDVTEADWTPYRGTDVVAGGFPCPDISSARTSNVRLGLEGPQSGLWKEMRRAIDEVDPRWVIIENSPEWQRWVPDVRRQLHERGYASVSFRVSAGTYGAPHVRPRCFVVAHANGSGEPLRAVHAEVAGVRPLPVRSGHWRHAFTGPVRVDNGTPDRMDRVKALGNAVVPAVAEAIGRAVINADRLVVAA